MPDSNSGEVTGDGTTRGWMGRLRSRMHDQSTGAVQGDGRDQRSGRSAAPDLSRGVAAMMEAPSAPLVGSGSTVAMAVPPRRSITRGQKRKAIDSMPASAEDRVPGRGAPLAMTSGSGEDLGKVEEVGEGHEDGGVMDGHVETRRSRRRDRPSRDPANCALMDRPAAGPSKTMEKGPESVQPSMPPRRENKVSKRGHTVEGSKRVTFDCQEEAIKLPSSSLAGTSGDIPARGNAGRETSGDDEGMAAAPPEKASRSGLGTAAASDNTGARKRESRAFSNRRHGAASDSLHAGASGSRSKRPRTDSAGGPVGGLASGAVAASRQRSSRQPTSEAKARGIARLVAELSHHIQTWLPQHRPPDRPFRLRPSMIMLLHRLGTEDTQPEACPGAYRDIAVHVKGTGPNGGTFRPPDHKEVPGLIEEMCDSLNEGWRNGGREAAASLTAQAYHRMLLIHPFRDGNGRVARALAYVVMCICLGRDPGLAPLIPSQFAQNRKALLQAVRSIDGLHGRMGQHQTGDIPGVTSPAGHSHEAGQSSSHATAQQAAAESQDAAAANLESLLISIWPPLSTVPYPPESNPAPLENNNAAFNAVSVVGARNSMQAQVGPLVVESNGLGSNGNGRSVRRSRNGGGPSAPPRAPSLRDREALREQLQCSICFQLMVEPVTTPRCGHSFCRQCIRSWSRAQQLTLSVPCPSCRVPIGNDPGAMPLSYTLKDLLDLVFPDEMEQRRQEAAAAAAAAPASPQLPQGWSPHIWGHLGGHVLASPHDEESLEEFLVDDDTELYTLPTWQNLSTEVDTSPVHGTSFEGDTSPVHEWLDTSVGGDTSPVHDWHEWHNTSVEVNMVQDRNRDRLEEQSWENNRGRSRDRYQDRNPDMERDRHRDRNRDGNRDQNQGQEWRDRSRDGNRDRSRGQELDRSRDGNRDRSRGQELDRSRDGNRGPEWEFSRNRNRDRNQDQERRDRSRDANRDQNQGQEWNPSRDGNRDRNWRQEWDLSRDGYRDRSQSHDRDRSRDRNRDRSQGQEWRDRNRDVNRDWSWGQDWDSSRDMLHPDMDRRRFRGRY